MRLSAAEMSVSLAPRAAACIRQRWWASAFQLRRRRQHLLGVDEQPARRQSVQAAGEQGLLGGIVQVMDRQCRNDEIVGTAQRCSRIIGDSEFDLLLVREAQAGLVEHSRRHVDQMQHRVGVGRPHQCCQQAGACPRSSTRACGGGFHSPISSSTVP